MHRQARIRDRAEHGDAAEAPAALPHGPQRLGQPFRLGVREPRIDQDDDIERQRERHHR